ncbi:sugar ABC transporter substrate-binding protein [Mangrovactinospora gilvigrisea]|uniref:Sugar ABC transporter substrate-binding protein n=1 Tax=Mangrovactinospora gilvigrisea TaxID=1428644 RepID=A0A1J7BKG3_9ACTN|nr:extracellular solute-binding protein [Mangrovactinospora gilvigrisea]OIV39126.1 sugar ABC transporter substrate-binding protein [Mangrovactinospora gilvigrisea]
MKRTHTAAATLAAAALVMAATGCSSGGSASTSTGGGNAGGSDAAASLHLPNLKGQKIQVAAVWTGAEQKNFLKVTARFDQLTGASTTFVPTGDNVSTFLGSKIQGGGQPDVAFLPQPGVLQQFAKAGWLKPVDSTVKDQLAKNYTPGWRTLGAYKGTQYGVYYKAANKSLVWYNTAAWQQAGLSKAPASWADLLKDGQTLSDSGTTPFSIGGGDGWTLTDWFENIYLSQAGATKYDQLTKHQIKWTDTSVAKALTTLAQLFGKPTLMAGGARGALQTDFPTSVDQTFAKSPKAAMVFEGDFAATNIAQETTAKVGTDAKAFPFPAVGSGQAPVVSGGDVAVALKNTKGAQALLRYLASVDGAETGIKQGGFLSPNKAAPLSTYTNSVERTIAQNLISAGDGFRFDMSDQSPAAFGGTKGQGEWKDLQDFLAKPSDVAGAQRKLEADAAKAYANAG